jgi:hypothetical protein
MKIDEFLKIIDKILKSSLELDCFSDMEYKIIGFNYTENIKFNFELLSEENDFKITIDVEEIRNDLEIRNSHFVFFKQDKIFKKLYKLHNFLLVQYYIKHHKFKIDNNILLLNVKKTKKKTSTLIL